MGILHYAGDANDSIQKDLNHSICVCTNPVKNSCHIHKVELYNNTWCFKRMDEPNYDGTTNQIKTYDIKVKSYISVDTRGFCGKLDAMLRIGFAVAWLTHPKNK